MEFPWFNGEDVNGWLYKCYKFFKAYDIPDSEKVGYAIYHLVGGPLHFGMHHFKVGKERKWEEFVESMVSMYGLLLCDVPIAELKNLRQEVSVQDYKKFVELIWRVNLPEEYAISMFVGGLSDEVQRGVRKHNPKTLKEAYSFAKLQENEVPRFGVFYFDAMVELKKLRQEGTVQD